jgi:CHASE1-domain containing sensor protein
MLTLGVWYAVAEREDKITEIEFRALAASHALLIEDGIKEYVAKVAALHALFNSDDDVKRGEFQAFAIDLAGSDGDPSRFHGYRA